MGIQKASLVLPDEKWEVAFKEMADDFSRANEGDRPKPDSWKQNSFPEYVRILREDSIDRVSGERIPNGLVATSIYWLAVDRRLIGTVRLRHGLNEHLENEGGNIGYDIIPSERRKGFGTLILSLGLKEARRLGMPKVLVTANEKNPASSRIIEKNGGVLENTIKAGEGRFLRRYWITL